MRAFVWVFLSPALGILEDGVLVLKASTIENHVASHYDRGLMVYFASEECGEACRKFGEEYAKAAQAVDVPLGKVQDDAVAEKYGVPVGAVRYLKRGRIIEIDVQDRQSIIKAAQRLSRDRCRTLDDVDPLFKEPGVRVALFGARGKQTYMRFVESFRYPVEFFYFPSNSSLETALKRAGLNAEKKNNVLLLKPFDEGAAVFALKKSSRKKKDLERWVETHMMPLVVPFHPSYMDMIFSGPLKMHVVLAVKPEEDFSNVRDLIYASAKEYRGKLLHIVMFEPPNEVAETEAEEGARQGRIAAWEFLKITTTPTIIVSDMTDATSQEPGGKQTVVPIDGLLDSLKTYAARAVARRHGVETRMADIMAQPKMQAMLHDPTMISMFHLMGMPQHLTTIYSDEL